VSPGSKVKCASRSSATRRAWCSAARVDTFEDDEGTTTHHSSVCVAAIKAALDFSPWATAARLAVPVAFFAGDFLVAFFAGFFVAFLTALRDDSTVRRCAVRRVTRRRDRGDGLGVSPRRSVALTSPSVT